MPLKTIGIIGGLGPMATVYYMEQITRMTDASCDQEHPRIYLQSIPDLPDRTAYILGKKKESPLPGMIRAGRELSAMGADFITVPCVTAQYFYQKLQDALDIPVLPLCEKIAEEVTRQRIHTVGVMATTGTMQTGVLEQSLHRHGIAVVKPSAELQNEVMQLIYGQVKSGAAIRWDVFRYVAASMLSDGAEKVILGCTELCVLKKEAALQGDPELSRIFAHDCIDVLEVLAQSAVLESGAALKKGVLHLEAGTGRQKRTNNACDSRIVVVQ
jgi:aspartate racemase